MKKYYLSLIGFTIMGISLLIGKWLFSKECTHKEVTPTKINGFVIIPSDSAEGKPTYTVIFNDSSVMDQMYVEEIAHGLSTGEWEYNDFLEEHVCIDPKTNELAVGECKCGKLKNKGE